MYTNSKIDYESEKIELYFSCRNLPNLDTFSKTDAKVILYTKSNNKWIKIGETEVVDDSLNPDFANTIIVDYYFEVRQQFKVDVIDIDDHKDHSKFDYVGSHEFELGKIVGNNKAYYKELKDNNNNDRGYIIMRYDKISKFKKIYYFDIQCRKIKNKRWFFSKSNPFLRFYKYTGNIQIDDNFNKIAQNQWVLTFQSKPAYKNLNPNFNKIKISSSKFCSNNNDLPLKIEIWDYHDSGSHKLLGYYYFRLSNLKNNTLDFKITSKSNKISGMGKILNFFEEDDYDIIDYIRSGLQIQSCISIDFTASNSDPQDINSLHYLNPNNFNLYQKAIYETSNILLNYDYDKQIPLFGFGFKFPNDKETKHMFPLTFDWNHTTVNGIESIMECYKNALNSIIFSGPTYFGPIIKTIINIIENNKQDINKYYVLTILTDGLIHDMKETIDLIVYASKLPLSIIIIGIGDEDFTNMEILDADDNALISSTNIKAQRDIVQFVLFKKFNNNQIELTKEVLFEIPTQIKDYSRLIKFKPTNNLYKQQNSLNL